MRTIAGIDTGTQSTKVVIYDPLAKEILATASAPHELIQASDGTREQEASWWIDAITRAFSKIDKELKETICAIGVSGQQHGFVPLDKEGNVLRAVKLWCDTSTAEQCRTITEAYGGEKRLLDEVGNLVLPGYTASKVLWLKEHHPDLYERLAMILLPHDYINYVLTGTCTAEYGDASGTALFDVRNRCWDPGVLKALDGSRDLLKVLPKLIEPHEPAGFVTSEAASLFGIPEGIPVSSGGGDNMMGAIGTGSVAPGVLTMSLGTSGTIYGYSDTPIIDTSGALAAFCSSTGGWLPLLCTMNCTVASELSRGLFGRSVKEFDQLAAKAPAGAQGVLMLPFFNGERTPNYPHGKGCIVGMDSTNMSEENISRAAMESAIYGMKMGVEALQALGLKASEVRLIGGGANSPLWRQIAADVLNLPVVIPAIAEAAAFGAVLQALWMLKTQENGESSIVRIVEEHLLIDQSKGCTPDAELVSRYQETYERYSDYVDALRPLFE